MKPASAPPITAAWLGLVVLTLLGLAFARWLRDANWLPFAVAAVIWLKGTLVARCFLESHRAHPFIAWLLRGFVAFAALALLVTSLFPETLARWTTWF